MGFGFFETFAIIYNFFISLNLIGFFVFIFLYYCYFLIFETGFKQ